MLMFCCDIYFNSMYVFSRLYLKDEHKAKKGKELDETKWTVGNLRPAVNKTDLPT